MKSRLNILLVEDNEGDIELVQRAVERANAPCGLTFAHNGQEALDLLRSAPAQQQPDVILLDINMPILDGKKFLEKLRADEELSLIPVIVLTSSSAPGDICDCYARHASAYFVKPFDPHKYIALINQILGYWADATRPPHAAPERSNAMPDVSRKSLQQS